MKHKLIRHTEECGKLVLIFAGWGTDADSYRNVSPDGWDVMVCWDFDDFNFDKQWVSEYHTIYLYAWSLGVFAAEQSLSGVEIASAVAVNGTRFPFDDNRGIPKSIFKGTCDGLNERNLKKFRMRMFEDMSQYLSYSHLLPENSDIEQLKNQLQLVMNTPPSNVPIKWNRAFVGMCDRIFPAQNQLVAWKEDAMIVTSSDTSHWADLNIVVAVTIINSGRVAERFRKSFLTYDDNAVAQRAIASQLCEMIDMQYAESTLEIGCGTGMLTRIYGKKMKIDTATFVDLCDLPDFAISSEECYIKADAEEWLECLPQRNQYDCILSASTIQWFSNVGRFFYNCSLHLKEGGVLALSTFAPGNLCELDEFRPSPIHYLPAKTLEAELKRWFSEVTVTESEEVVKFSTPHEALKHLKLTGVTASADKLSLTQLKRLMQRLSDDDTGYCKLTYRPIYIIAKNKK